MKLEIDHPKTGKSLDLFNSKEEEILALLNILGFEHLLILRSYLSTFDFRSDNERLDFLERILLELNRLVRDKYGVNIFWKSSVDDSLVGMETTCTEDDDCVA